MSLQQILGRSYQWNWYLAPRTILSKSATEQEVAVINRHPSLGPTLEQISSNAVVLAVDWAFEEAFAMEMVTLESQRLSWFVLVQNSILSVLRSWILPPPLQKLYTNVSIWMVTTAVKPALSKCSAACLLYKQ